MPTCEHYIGIIQSFIFVCDFDSDSEDNDDEDDELTSGVEYIISPAKRLA